MPPSFPVRLTGTVGNATGLPYPEAEFTITALAFPRPSLGIAVGSRNKTGSASRDPVLLSRDGGQSWSGESIPDLSGLNLLSCTAAAGCLIGASTSTAVLRYTTFSRPTAGPGRENVSAWVVGYLIHPQNTPGLVTSTPVILSTADGGQTWRTQGARTALPDAQLMTVSFVNARDGWVLGVNEAVAAAVVLATTDGGTTWRQEYSLPYRPTGIALSSLTFVNRRDGRAFGATILRTVSGGRTWTVEPLPHISKTLKVKDARLHPGGGQGAAWPRPHSTYEGA